ncbi:MAG: hypothetical protein PUE00_05710 [Thermobifida fusca]|nr:hypothetical protein [Thermobifida fusca]
MRERLWRITFLDAGITLAVAGITAVSTVLPAVDSPGGLASLQVLLPWGWRCWWWRWCRCCG